MKYSNIRIVDLKTCDDCYQAIESIERDSSNSSGDWFDGGNTYLLEGAKNKIEAIQRKDDKIYKKMIKNSYQEYVKATDNPVSFEVYDENEMYC